MKHYNKSITGLSIFGDIGAIVIAVLGILSYVPGFGLLGSIRDDYIPMAPSTAISFIILGSCLYVMSMTMLSRMKLTITLSATTLVSLFGFLEVVGFYYDMDLNFEHRIVPAAGHLNNIPIARMSPATGLIFLFAGIAIILLLLRGKFRRYRVWFKHLGGIFGCVIILGGFIFCLSYLYGTPLLYGEGAIIPMALTTALAFMLLGFGIIGFAGKSAFPMYYLVGSSISSYLLRYILPLSILSVILGGIVVIYAHHHSQMNPALASASLTVIMTFFAGIFAVLISKYAGNTIDRAEKIIAETTNSLSESEERFRAIFEQSGGCFLILELKSNDSLIIVDANEAACEFHGYTKYELIGKLFSELSDDPDKAMHVKQIEQVLEGDSYVEETTHVRKDGTIFPILSYFCRIQIGESLPLILSAEYDITNLTCAEEEIKQLGMFPSENPAPVMRVDKDGLLLYANNSSMPLLNYWTTSINSKLPQAWCGHIAKVLEQNQTMEHEIQYDEVSLYLTLCPIKDMNYVNIYGYDITERKQLEMFPNENPAPVMRVDKDGLLLYANNSSMPLLNYWTTSINSKLPQAWCGYIAKVLEQNQTMEHEIQYDEVSLYLTLCPIKDMNYVNIYAYDITERKRAEDMLHKSEALLNEVGSIAMIGGWEMNLITRKSVWTQGTYDIVEMEPDQPAPGPDEHISYYLPEFRAMVKKGIQQLITKNIPLDYEAKFKTTKGNIKWCHACGKGARKNGKCIKIYGTFQDITARKLIEEELADYREHLEKMINEKTDKLQQANEELKSFSYSVSHDLRAPLRVLDGFSKMLLDDYKKKLDKGGQDLLNRIRNASVKMGGLIDSLLMLSKISKLQMKAEKTDLSEIAKNISTKFLQDSPERDAVFVIQPDMIVDGDSNLLEIVLGNLLGNAWKFTHKKKKTQIEFSSQKDEKNQKEVYSIKDNGAGFNMDYSNKLFGAFQRLHSQNEFEGSGIGLATVKRIIQLHNGEVWAESVEGEGTVFYFTLNI
jgi:PAS domain S-box-containing protein